MYSSQDTVLPVPADRTFAGFYTMHGSVRLYDIIVCTSYAYVCDF